VYGVSLGDLFTGRLPWRRLLTLLEQLPAGSRVGRVEDIRNTWGLTDYLIAQVADMVVLVADELAALRWLYRSVNRGKGRAPKRPQPYPRLPRPGQQRQRATENRKRLRPAEAVKLAAQCGVPVTLVPKAV
jgi:hypothetical protein